MYSIVCFANTFFASFNYQFCRIINIDTLLHSNPLIGQMVRVALPKGIVLVDFDTILEQLQVHSSAIS